MDLRSTLLPKSPQSVQVLGWEANAHENGPILISFSISLQMRSTVSGYYISDSKKLCRFSVSHNSLPTSPLSGRRVFPSAISKNIFVYDLEKIHYVLTLYPRLCS